MEDDYLPPPRRLVMIQLNACDFCHHPQADLSYPDMTPTTHVQMTGIPSEVHCGWQVCLRERCRETCRQSRHLYSYTAEEAQHLLYQHQVLETPDALYAWVIRSRTNHRERWRWEPHPVTRINPVFLMRSKDGNQEKLVYLDQLIAARPERHPAWVYTLQQLCETHLFPDLFPVLLDYT
jgi:hypothetical protein